MRIIVFILSALLLTFVGIGQVCPTYTSMQSVLQGTSQVASGAIINFATTGKPGTQTLRERCKSTKLYYKLDLGENYVKQNAVGWKFTIVINVAYSINSGSTTVKTLSVTETQPERLKIEDLTSSFGANNPAITTTLSLVSITDGTNVLSGNGLLQNFVFSQIRLSTSLVREYEVDVRSNSNALPANALQILPVNIQNRLVTFSWQPNGTSNFPNYEVQVLKIVNIDLNLSTDLNQVNGIIDWEKALKIETQSCKNSMSINMAEGSGYYIWRVRAIGNYFKGGIANAENYGLWSVSTSPTVTTIQLNKTTLTPTNAALPFAYFFVDPDEDLNWIYSRVYTEGDVIDKANPTGVKASEGISYADGLLRKKQDQKFNSSENTNIISQTISDYSGRPALTSVPVPSAGGLNGYKAGITKDVNGNLYTAKNFDEDANYQEPEQLKDINTPFSYYSGNSSLSTNGIDNANVPSAEGFPYTRTQFATDGSGRVVETSGIGKVHAIGSRVNGKGRTTRTYYSTPSEDELIRIFGDEAPISSSVIKTTVIDQNDVMSITYTSKEGKTIATALSSSTVNNLQQLGTSGYTVTNVIDQNINSGGRILGSKRFMVPKLGKVINISHTTSGLPGANGGCVTASCNYNLRLYLTDLVNKVTYVSDANSGTSTIDNFTITSGSTTSFGASWIFKDIAGVAANIVPGGAGNNDLSLPEGEYIIVKELLSANGENAAEQLADAEDELTRPIFDAIAEKMKQVKGPLKKIQFDAWMVSFRAAVSAYQLAPTLAKSDELLKDYLCIDVSQLKPNFTFPLANLFNLNAASTNTDDPTMENLTITTSCCGSLSVPVPKSSVCVPCDGSPEPAYQSTVSISTMTAANATAASTVATPYGFWDFTSNTNWNSMTTVAKRNAINSLVEREFIGTLKGILDEAQIPYTDLWKIAPGFSFESLNFMISNMLISQYYEGTAIKSGTTWYETSVATGGGYTLGAPVSATSPTYAYNYNCKSVYEAWMTSISVIGGFDAEAGSGNVLQEHDNEHGNNSALSEFLNKDQWKPALQKAVQVLSGPITNVINKHKNSNDGSLSKDKIESVTCLPANFVGMLGSKFAAIIDGDKLPTYVSASEGRYPDDYYDFVPVSTPTPASIYTTIITGNASTGVTSNTYVPLLFTIDNTNSIKISTLACNGSTLNETYYKYILKPEWMFKYYVYNVFENGQSASGNILNFIPDNDLFLPNQVQMDIDRNYKAPFAYLTAATAGTNTAVNLCSQPIANTFTLGTTSSTLSYEHLNWTVKERVDFYNSIRGAAACFVNKGVTVNTNLFDNGTAPVCATKAEMFQMASATIDEYISSTQGRKQGIQNALVTELENACYTVVACKSNVPQAGEVTMKEVELMAQMVIDTAISILQGIKNNFTVTTIPNVSACTSTSLLTQSYSPISNCSLPACIETSCKVIVLYDNNTLGLTDSKRMEMKFWKDCDQLILDMLEQGTFLPDIAPLNANCTKAAKVWKSCTGQSNCGPYGEKTGCPTSDYKKYSREYQVTATGTGN